MPRAKAFGEKAATVITVFIPAKLKSIAVASAKKGGKSLREELRGLIGKAYGYTFEPGAPITGAPKPAKRAKVKAAKK